MTHVVAEPCFNCKYTDCVTVCPVECFYEGEAMLFIHPDECIDCEACVPECPPASIFHQDNLPKKWANYAQLNAEMALNCPQISERRDPLGPPIDKGYDEIPVERLGEGKHFVAYHNSERRGREFGHERFLISEECSWGTKKAPNQFVGGKLWCISGHGNPREYLLHGWLTVDWCKIAEDHKQEHRIGGPIGFAFEQPIPLKRYQWFADLLKSQSNFSLGVQPIKEEFVSAFDALCVSFQVHESGVNQAESDANTELLLDGKPIHEFVRRYRRNPVARRKCIEHWGTICDICGHDFKAEYGPEVDAKVHVHHLRPLSEIAEEHELDPINDLRPVCPNCHAALHSRDPIFSIQELTEMRRQLDR